MRRVIEDNSKTTPLTPQSTIYVCDPSLEPSLWDGYNAVSQHVMKERYGESSP